MLLLVSKRKLGSFIGPKHLINCLCLLKINKKNQQDVKDSISMKARYLGLAKSGTPVFGIFSASRCVFLQVKKCIHKSLKCYYLSSAVFYLLISFVLNYMCFSLQSWDAYFQHSVIQLIIFVVINEKSLLHNNISLAICYISILPPSIYK